MEKINTHIDKVIGKNEYQSKIIYFLDNLGKDKIIGELEKTNRDKQIINFTQEKLNKYLSEFNKENIYDIPHEKIHLVSSGEVYNLTKKAFEEGVASSRFGSCIIDRKENNINFSIILFHEMYHIKDFTSIKINDNVEIPENYRSGFTVYTKDGKERFRLINETINDYFCKKFYEEEILNSKLFTEEDINNYKFESPRKALLEKFENICQDLYEKNTDQFKSKEDIRKLFIDADINGHFLPIAKLIEKTYGEGTFRRISDIY